MVHEQVKHDEDNFPGIDGHMMKKASLAIRCLNHYVRQKILKTINKQSRMTVKEIYKSLNLQQAAASQHLALLRKAGIVSAGRVGRLVYYSINHKKVDDVKVFLAAL